MPLCIWETKEGLGLSFDEEEEEAGEEASEPAPNAVPAA
jgi:hypothetical protein